MKEKVRLKVFRKLEKEEGKEDKKIKKMVKMVKMVKMGKINNLEEKEEEDKEEKFNLILLLSKPMMLNFKNIIKLVLLNNNLISCFKTLKEC